MAPRVMRTGPGKKADKVKSPKPEKGPGKKNTTWDSIRCPCYTIILFILNVVAK
jgi:hypothetical protein